jgi:hypothetical protein
MTKSLQETCEQSYRDHYAPYSLDDNGNRVEPSLDACEYRSWEAAFQAGVKARSTRTSKMSGEDHAWMRHS